jgi:hypothetical protein
MFKTEMKPQIPNLLIRAWQPEHVLPTLIGNHSQ